MTKEKKKSFEKKEELIKASIKEFSEKGYDKASLNNILKEVGISKGAFYYHFNNKEDLYFYLLSIVVDKKMKFLTENIKPQDLNNDIFTIFKIQVETAMEFGRLNPDISKFGESFIRERGNEIYHKALKKFDFQINDYFDILINNAFNRGELRDDLPKDFIKNIIAYLFTHVTEMINVANINDIPNISYYLIEFMKSGLKSKSI